MRAAVARGGGQEAGGALGERLALRSRGKNFAAAAGARGRRCTPAAGAGGGGGWGRRGRGRPRPSLPAGAARFGFCLASLPLPSKRGRPRGGRGCRLPGLRPPRPASQGRARGSAASLLPPLPQPLPPLDWCPCPSSCRRWLPQPRRWEGDCIRRPPLALPFSLPSPSCSAWMRLPAPSPPGPAAALMGGEWPDRVEPIQLHCSTRDTSSAGRLSGRLIKFPPWRRSGSWAGPPQLRVGTRGPLRSVRRRLLAQDLGRRGSWGWGGKRCLEDPLPDLVGVGAPGQSACSKFGGPCAGWGSTCCPQLGWWLPAPSGVDLAVVL